MRTPDEIKEWLGDPVPVHFHRGNPEPCLTPLAYKTLEELFADALALIQQKEQENAEQAERIRVLEDHLREATKKIEQLEAERDALIEQARENDVCVLCKHKDVPCDAEPCVSCCAGGLRFEWRGVQKEE